jgi:hypothetical protein
VTLPFTKTTKPFCDFLIHVSKNTDLKNPPDGFERRLLKSFGGFEAYIVCSPGTAVRSGFLFSGYMQHKGKMYIGEIPAPVRDADILETAEGYFTFVLTDDDKITVSQDTFGKNMLFYGIHGDTVLVSNRYHLLLLYLRCLGIEPEINYDKILLMMCSEDSTFSHQGVTRDMFCAGHFILTMAEKIIIDKNGFRVEEKKKIVDAFYTKNEAETKRLFEQGVEEIRENGRAVFSRDWKDGVVVDFTGGYDSRGSFASVLSTGSRDFTVRTEMNLHSIGDIVVSECAVEKFGLQRNVTPLPVPPAYEGASAYEKYFNDMRSLFMGEQFQYTGIEENPPDMTREHNIGAIRVTGGWGEIYKDYYTRRYLPKYGKGGGQPERTIRQFY